MKQSFFPKLHKVLDCRQNVIYLRTNDDSVISCDEIIDAVQQKQ